jgi:hypothetical protein
MRLAVLQLVTVSLPVAALHSEPAHTPRSKELAIIVVDFDLTMSLHVSDARTGTPISGAMIRFVRSGEGKTLAPETAKSDQRTKTDRRGAARLAATFAGNLCTCGWVEAYAGDSVLVATAPGYAASRVRVSGTGTLRFRGKDTSRSASYRLALRRETPNQAMQRTAGRSAFPLSMTSTFNRQRRPPSPSVADLVSR